MVIMEKKIKRLHTEECKQNEMNREEWHVRTEFQLIYINVESLFSTCSRVPLALWSMGEEKDQTPTYSA